MSWAYQYSLQGPIMNTITYICILVAALYINASFIIQIPLINSGNPKWIDWVGLDNFSSKNDKFTENLSGYAVTVIVYITSLIYRKAASKYSIKEKYMKQRYPEKFMQNKGIKLKNVLRKKVSLWKSVFENIKNILKNPVAHLLAFRFCLFIWVYLYFSFQSLLPLFMLWHSLIFKDRQFLIGTLKNLYLPLLWLVFFFHYFVNILYFINDVFDKDIYTKNNQRYGIYKYSPAFTHLLFQIFTLFYGCFCCYLFREYDQKNQQLAEIKEIKEKRRQAKLNQAVLGERLGSLRSKNQNSFANESILTELTTGKEEHIYTYEILLRYFLKNIDILPMIILYVAGVNRIDVYHMFLLILFVIFIIYPEIFRKNFILLLYFMIFIGTIKYMYVLFLDEFQRHTKINRWFKVFGFSTDIEEKNTYGKSNLFNNNYAIILSGFIQYKLYTSDYSKKAFSEEQTSKDLNTFATRYPRLMKILTI